MGYFERRSRVRKLDLSFNNLTQIPDNGFLGVDGLHTLNLNSNLFKTIPKQLNGTFSFKLYR